jgi:flagellar hook protein FlgE
MSIRSLDAAASGIDTMQTDLDTIGNDIANSETDGYVSQTAEFSDVLTEQLTPAGGAVAGSLASTNPSTVGAGDEVSAIETDFTPGEVTQTGINSDVAVQGNGFMVVSQGGQTYYTLDGDLQVDADGNLATNSGGLVEGWGPGQPTSAPLQPLTIKVGSTGQPVQTQNIVLGGNLPSDSTGPVTVTTTMYDSLGHQVPVTLTLTPTLNADGTATSWSMQGTVTGATANLWSAAQTVVFTSGGQRESINGTAVGAGETDIPIDHEPSNYTWAGTTMPTIDFPPVGSEGAVTQYAGDQTIAVASQDGNDSGTLESYSIGGNGVITGIYSNGNSATLGTIALATFANNDGLDDVGQTYFTTTVASGKAQLGQPGSDGYGSLQGGAVVSSNVDLATELTDLIEAQTAYQANTKVVDTTSTVLQSLMEMS